LNTTGTRRPKPNRSNPASNRRSLLSDRETVLPGNDLQVAGTAGEITDGDSPKLARLEDPERFRLAFEYANSSIALVDLEGNIFEANKACSDLFGCTTEELKSLNLLDIWVAEDRVEAMADFRKVANGSKTDTVFERRYRNKKGEIIFAEVLRGLARSQTGEPKFFVVSFRDITGNKRLQALLELRAATDPLTGAMNRNGIEERVHYELMRSDRYGDNLSLVLIDLDHFKVVNDTYGHLAGDRILRGFCDIARSCLRSTDSLGRVGGEEFVALLSETGLAGARLFAERLRTTLEEFRFDGGIRITASMGVAGHREGEEFASLIERADASMYLAKQSGRNRVVLDSEDLKREAARKTQGAKVTLHWKPSYLSGQPLVDAEHEELFRLVNLIMAEMAEGEAEKRMLPLVHELIEHIQTHFRNEEQLLLAAGFPDATAHAEIHRSLLERACELTRQFELHPDSAGDLLGFLIHNVVARHMLQDDRKFFPWLKANQA
jgi:diguanylate cyclase (GGDEF)-like protein/hemerythrin-like metal-binding protein/PAS domain S-box-containing protein